MKLELFGQKKRGSDADGSKCEGRQDQQKNARSVLIE